MQPSPISASQPSVVHSTFVLERHFPQPPERVFAAFADAEQKRRWFAEGGKSRVEEYGQEFRVGGRERIRFRFHDDSPLPGALLVTDGEFHDIEPNRRIVTASTMTLGERRISIALVTIELLPSAAGTDLICTHQGAYFEGSGGAEMREEGWRKLLEQLATKLAE